MYDIDRYKRASARVIGNFEGMNSPAHISLNQQHRCKPFIAQHGLSQMAEKLGHITPLELHIHNFKYFTHGPNSMTIYACIVINDRSERWFRALRDSMRVVNKTYVPHITIVKTITAEQFRKLWPKFQQCNFQSSFVADRLIILEKDTHDPQSRWQKYREFKFGHKLMEY